MKTFVKYGIVSITTFCLLLVVTMILLPVVLNVQRFVPRIEKEVSTLIARPFSLGSDLTVSFFPWVGIACSDLKIGNQPGFRSDDLLRIGSFEARIKLWPLLRGKLEFSRFIVGGLVMNLESASDNRVNWKNSDPNLSNMSYKGQLPSFLRFLQGTDQADLFVITDGAVIWNDRTNYSHHELTDLMVVLHDFSLTHRVNSEMQVVVDGHHFSLEGSFEPDGQADLKKFTYSFQLLAEKAIRGNIQGHLQYADTFGSRAHLQIDPFTPADLPGLSRSGKVDTTAAIFHSPLSLDMQMSVDSSKLKVESAHAKLADSKLDCTMESIFSQKHLLVSCAADQLNFDPYLKAFAELKGGMVAPVRGIGNKAENPSGLNVSGALHAAQARLIGMQLNDLKASFTMASDGRWHVDPFEAGFYGGQLTGNTLDSSENRDWTEVELSFTDVDAQPLFSDIVGWSFLSGQLGGKLDVQIGRYDAETPFSWIAGSGHLSLFGGALSGVELGGEQGSIAGAGESEKSSAVKRTPFDHLDLFLNLGQGLLSIGDGSMEADGMYLIIGGVADLKHRDIDLLFTPSGHENAEHTVAMKGTFDAPVWYNVHAATGTADGAAGGTTSMDVNRLVERQLPSPPDVQEKGLVGKALMDPEVVAQRIGLHPMTGIGQPKEENSVAAKKEKYSIRIAPLRQEKAFR